MSMSQTYTDIVKWFENVEINWDALDVITASQYHIDGFHVFISCLLKPHRSPKPIAILKMDLIVLSLVASQKRWNVCGGVHTNRDPTTLANISTAW